jgi:hypothetical protein
MPHKFVEARLHSDLSNPLNIIAVTLDDIIELYEHNCDDEEIPKSFNLVKGYVKELLVLLGGYQIYLEKINKLEE